ncbi:hypothetical protein EMCRGX_G000143 [Ephydatia muelleri]
MALDFSKRPKRTTKRTPKAKELEGSCEEIQSRSIKVKCGQTGKVFVTKIHNLSKEDQAESLTIEDLKVGAGLLCDVKGKMYPVEVLEFEGHEKDVVHSLMGPSTISKVKIHDSGDQSKRAVLLHAIEGSASTLEATSSSSYFKQSPKQMSPSFNSSESQNSNAAQTEEMLTLLRSINGKMSQILEHITAGPDQVKPMKKTLVKRHAVPVMRKIGSMVELGESLLFSSLKSTKPALCQDKVERIIAIMKKQFPTEPFDLQVFTQKANQKCRDAATMHRPLPKDIVEL